MAAKSVLEDSDLLERTQRWRWGVPRVDEMIWV